MSAAHVYVQQETTKRNKNIILIRLQRNKRCLAASIKIIEYDPNPRWLENSRSLAVEL